MANLMRNDRRGDVPSRSVFSDFFSDVDRFLGEDFFLMPMQFSRQMEKSMPAVNIRDNEKEYLIEVAAPGMKKDDFNIDMDEHMLTISSHKEEEKSEDGDNFKRREYNYSSFSRSFKLPDNAKAEDIKAQYKDGVLSLTVPKKQEQEKTKKKIKID